jgi:hypothetical protein
MHPAAAAGHPARCILLLLLAILLDASCCCCWPSRCSAAELLLGIVAHIDARPPRTGQMRR